MTNLLWKKVKKRPVRPIKPHKLHGLSRRLRIELMEERKLLSVTSQSFAAEPQFVYVTTGIGELVSVPIQIRHDHSNNIFEGGFVNTFMLSGQDQQAITLRSNADLSVTISNLISNGSFLDEYEPTTYSNFDLFGADTLAPRAIDASEAAPVISTSFEPARHEGLSVSEPQEGGLISINSGLPPMGPQVESKSAISSMATASATSLQRTISALRAEGPDSNSSMRELSGEWARAAVFEIAGGEPLSESLQASDGDETPDGKPLPDTTAQAADESSDADGDRSVARTAAKPVVSDAPAGEVDRQASAHSVHGTAPAELLPTTMASFLAAFPSQTAVPWNDLASRASISAITLATYPDEALARAFDEFGDGELAVSSPSTDAPWLRGWLIDTPILMMFALERVTARRARRRRTTDGAVEVGRPHTA